MLSFLLFIKLFVPIDPDPVPVFSGQTIDSSISIGYGIALGDVDGDGKPDILLADKKQVVWYRNGDWKKFLIIENLTQFDNVCIAARDLDGDGKVEIAVGAQWNPSETSNAELSGSVHYLLRPDDLSQQWKAVELHHEPTVHRMRWMKLSDGKYYLVVVPLHGQGNKGGEGAGAKILAYEYQTGNASKWPVHTLSGEMHLTHNLAILEKSGGKTDIYIAGKEGVRVIHESPGGKPGKVSETLPGKETPSGEVRISKDFITAIGPMHGNQLVVYPNGKQTEKIILDTNLNEGHALGVADFSGAGYDQVVAGWRSPDKDGLVGIKIYSSKGGKEWESDWIDKNGMACEDLQVMDMNGDGKTDIIASGRSTKNLKIYWNRTD